LMDYLFFAEGRVQEGEIAHHPAISHHHG
jgi:hypothetical protein